MSDKKGFSLFTKSKAAESARTASSPLAKPKNVKQRWLLVGVGTLVVMGMASSLFKGEEDQVVRAKPAAPMVDVTPQVAEKRAFEANFGQKLEQLNLQVEKLRKDAESKEAAIRELESKNKELSERTRLDASGSAKGPIGGALGADSGNGPPKPPVLPEILRTPQAPPGLPSTPPSVVPPLGSGTQPGTFAPAPLLQGKPMQFEAPLSADEGPAVEAKLTYKKNENAGKIPLAFASMSLLNGIDAGTSQATQSNPLPVLVSINDHAQLPGMAKYRLKGCFALGTGYGDLSAERVYVRVSRLSCVDKENKLVLSQEVAGYVSDADGTLGLRGKVEDRQGARLGKALLAGFAQGLAGALGAAQSTVSSSSVTGAVTSSLTGGSALRASGLSGAQNAANQLAEFYLKEAQSIFPVIAIENGRAGTLVLTSDSKLEWTSTQDQYVPQVTPTNKR